MDDLNWIKGCLRAFKFVNDRRNNAHDFVIRPFSDSQELTSSIDLWCNTKDTSIQDSSPLLNPIEDIAVALHGWLFVFIGFENDRSEPDPDRLIDNKNYFSMSHAEDRMRICTELATAICNVTQIQSGRSLIIRSDESYLSFGRHFLIEGGEARWWIWFGGYF